MDTGTHSLRGSEGRQKPLARFSHRAPARACHRTHAAPPPHPPRASIFAELIMAAAKLFYTGPLINAEMLVTMLEKHNIPATQAFAEPDLPDDGDLNRVTKVFVPDTDYDRAWNLFYAERQDEL